MAGQIDADIELIAQCQRGDQYAFNRLVMQYQNLVYNFLYRLAPRWENVDDLAQDVFIKVYCSIKQLKDRAQFKSWLHKIAVSVYIDEQRRRKKQRERFVSDEHVLDTQADPNANIEQTLERKELQQHLQDAIDQLPDEFKLAIVLREVEDLSYEEIATVLKCSIGTVRSRIFRGRQLLQRSLQDHLP